jgi:hypothetical protein
MKANELMIGDWVLTDMGEQMQVFEIHEDEVMLDYNDMYDYADIEPIPLTKEILEKNDWEERPTGHVFYTDGKRYDNSLWYIFGSNTFVVNTAEFQIKYVHELQHLLKLLGMDKTYIL